MIFWGRVTSLPIIQHPLIGFRYPGNGYQKITDDICLPRGTTNIRLLNIFLFDFLENLLVLWGEDPRFSMPKPLPVIQMAVEWFHRSLFINQTRLAHGNTEFIPFSVFNSIHVAQIVFGEQTLNKLTLLNTTTLF